jgi:demethylmenaquinone methyltransferase/2-methoxy-6-polyprenyl-1,4-benzoquinol methylase
VGSDDLERLLAEQVDYYRARANEYDETGLVGADEQGRRLQAALASFGPRGRVLELACGTGQWTGRLAATAQHVTAVDSSPEALAINRAAVADPHVQYVEADLFTWRSPERYDTVFFAFWLSHVPPERFEAFWALVSECLAPDGRVFFVEDRPTLAAYEQPAPGEPEYVVHRALLDGRTYRAIKAFRDPAWIVERLAGLGWAAEAEVVGPHLFCATARRA